jgi:hypothetical protein
MVLLKKKLKQLLSDSTANGIPNVFKIEGFLNKIFWLIFSLLATSFSVYYSLKAIDDFFNYNFVTQIENVYQQPLQFPTITICDDGTKTNEKTESVEFFNEKSPDNLIKECNTMHDSKNCTNNQNNFFEMLRFVIFYRKKFNHIIYYYIMLKILFILQERIFFIRKNFVKSFNINKKIN